MTAVVLPGDIPGLLRKGSPVVLATRTYGGSVFLDGARGVVCSDGGRVGTETLGGSPVLVSTSPRDLALDLTDATGRAHAAWWWNSRRQRSTTASEPFFSAMFSPSVRYLSGGRHLHAVSRPAGRPGYLATADVVPALAVLDPDDGARLPDGSRWVDAEALRLVCLHVAGRAP